jgi:GNAT superfamily N-acetyltransferase
MKRTGEAALPVGVFLTRYGRLRLLVAEAQGMGLGSWLLRTALNYEWKLQPRRVWLHTDNWDHPAALRLYESAGFRTYMVREEPPGDL